MFRWRSKLVVAVVLVASAAVYAYTTVRRPDDTPVVDSVRVTRRTIATEVKATGVIRPMTGAQVRVGPRVSGIVRTLSVRVGDRVSRGQLLAELDDRELVARHQEALASLNLAKANFAFTTAELRRKQALSDGGLLARNDLDLAQNAAAVAEQEVGRAQALLEYAATQLTYSRVEAPISGVVASVATQEGETVAASFATPTFVTLLDLNRLEVWAYVDETDIGRVRIGQPATFTVDTYGSDPFEARVTEIYPQAEVRDNVVDYVTVLRFRALRDRPLRPEMTTSVRIAIAASQDVLAVPLKALHREKQQPYVWRRRAGAVTRVPVTLGLKDNSYWEVRAGLDEGDEILTGAPPQNEGESQ
jgi:HlyD family secretion protein